MATAQRSEAQASMKETAVHTQTFSCISIATMLKLKVVVFNKRTFHQERLCTSKVSLPKDITNELNATQALHLGGTILQPKDEQDHLPIDPGVPSGCSSHRGLPGT